MPDQPTTDPATLDDEALFDASVALRQRITDGATRQEDGSILYDDDATAARAELIPVELERLRRRHAAYDVAHAAAETDEDRARIKAKQAATAAGIAKLDAEGFSDDVQHIGPG